ncbi:MAG: MgtC/SapB family protein [Marvinbryantia sp.]|uniref:MgtC/SapB family protein n=1 Tax=Marvinbryantia sp. TaxID=2496532 RepID=UPI0025D877EC|nr:MgtC/SapB family protein [uncultured Marvinbryantia sp.]
MDWCAELSYFIRIGMAGVCGILIGMERQHRTKSAGIRTHFMVSIATALMMIISKYGFLDVAGMDGLSCDVSRVAAGIISGVGILSGGLILIGKQGYVSGITTASGVWVTIAIGMALGAGLYSLGIGTTVIVLVAQVVFHSRLSIFREQTRAMLVFKTEKGSYEGLLQKLEAYGAKVHSVKWDYKNENYCQMKCQAYFPDSCSRRQIMEFVSGCENVDSVELIG